MLQIVLLATGVVLIVNGWSLLSGAQVRGTIALNLLLGVLDIAFAVYYAVTGDYYGALKVALFGITYAWYALNLLLGVSNHQTLGWYCFAVVVAAVPIAVDTFRADDPWFGSFWVLWAGLWLLFFLIMGLGVDRATRFTGGYALAISLVTCLGPGSLITSGAWQIDQPAQTQSRANDVTSGT